jgi:hypothetical protein
LLSHGCFTEAFKTLKSSKEFGVALPDLDVKIADMLNNLAQTEPRVTQERIQTEISYALSTLTEERIRHHEVVTTCERDFEDGLYVVTTRLLFKGTLVDEMRLDSKLANLLSNDADWNPCILSTGFECRQYDYVST